MLNAGPQVNTISMSWRAVLITRATGGLWLAARRVPGYERSVVRVAPGRYRKQTRKESVMEDRNDIHYEDDALDRELNALVREMEQQEVIRRTVIEMLVMLGSDAMLEHDV